MSVFDDDSVRDTVSDIKTDALFLLYIKRVSNAMKWKTDYYESKRGDDGYFHFIYKVTNRVNGKYYIGVHNTTDLGDGYKGSGNILKEAYKKYGKKSFDFEIMEFFETAEESYNKESEIVNEDLVKDPMCYNVMLGGKGSKTGYLPMKNTMTGDIEYINITDNNGKYISVNKGNIPVYDKILEKYRRIPKNEFDESIHVPMHKGKIILFNIFENKFEQVDVNDPRRETGELVSVSKNKVTVTDGNGNWYQVDKTHPDYINGKLKTCSKNKWTLRNKMTKECISVEKGSEVDWNIYEFVACRLKKEDNPDLVYAKLIGEKKYKFYSKNDGRFQTYDLLPYVKNEHRNIYVTNGIIEVALYENEIDDFLKYHIDWCKGRKKYKYKDPDYRKKHAWVNNGVINKMIQKDEVKEFLINNPDWKSGCLINHKNKK